jgi:hypothetical protein
LFHFEVPGQVRHGDLQSGLFRERGQFGLPQPQPGTVGPAAVGGDQQPLGKGVGVRTDLTHPERVTGEVVGVDLGRYSDRRPFPPTVARPPQRRHRDRRSHPLDPTPADLPRRRTQHQPPPLVQQRTHLGIHARQPLDEAFPTGIHRQASPHNRRSCTSGPAP